jgi:hypothetical protein
MEAVPIPATLIRRDRSERIEAAPSRGPPCRQLVPPAGAVRGNVPPADAGPGGAPSRWLTPGLKMVPLQQQMFYSLGQRQN